MIFLAYLEKSKILFYSNKYHMTIRSFNRRKGKVSFDEVAEFSTISKFGYNYHVCKSGDVVYSAYVRKFRYCSFDLYDLSFMSRDLYYSC